MLSMSIQPSLQGRLTTAPSFSLTTLSCVCSKSSFSVMHQKASSLRSIANSNLKSESAVGIQRLPRAAAELASAEALDEISSDSETFEVPQVGKREKETEGKLRRPRVVLKFIWMEKNIGVGLDQMIAGHGSVPLSPYYFWPRKDAWEELKTTLESKPWISNKKMIILLNQTTDIINLWQQSGGNFS